MIPRTISIRAIRGFQAEREIALSPSLTVIHGENGRGKTSLCEGWHWLFTGEMLQGLEPRSEIASAGKNIHVDLEPRVRLLSEDGQILVERSGDRFANPAALPSSTSPALLQYRLQQVLYTSQSDRRRFFEEVLELTLEAGFAQTLRQARQRIHPFDHEAWGAWRRATEAVTGLGFVPPHPSPTSSLQQKENERVLLGFVSRYFDCEATPHGLKQGAPVDASLELFVYYSGTVMCRCHPAQPRTA